MREGQGPRWRAGARGRRSGGGGGGGSVKCNRISQASIHSQKGRQEGQGHEERRGTGRVDNVAIKMQDGSERGLQRRLGFSGWFFQNSPWPDKGGDRGGVGEEGGI